MNAEAPDAIGLRGVERARAAGVGRDDRNLVPPRELAGEAGDEGLDPAHRGREVGRYDEIAHVNSGFRPGTAAGASMNWRCHNSRQKRFQTCLPAAPEA